MRTTTVRRVLVALVALAGLVSLCVGIGLRTIWLPPDQVQVTASAGGSPVAVTEPGVLESLPGPVTVQARGAGSEKVLLAVGTEPDVLAWVGESAHTAITGLVDLDTIGTERVEGDGDLPDPASSDLWVQRESGEGTASLEYAPPPGRWLLLAASDGSAPAPTVTLTWPRVVSTPWAVPLVVAGALLLLGALVAAVLMARGRRLVGAR